MAKTPENLTCSCGDELDRRHFLAASAGIAGAVAGGSLLGANQASAAPSSTSAAEVAVAELYATLSDEQKKVMALPYDDARRTKISANWSITPAKIETFTKSQQDLIHRVVKGITSEDGYDRFLKQMASDWGSFGRYTVAIFGKPNDGPYQFELTGRHLTMRADGDTAQGAAFGGPIVYGHAAAGNSDKNLFSYQTHRANEVFAALDEDQRAKALLPKAPRENAVQLRDDLKAIPGIAGSELSDDQKALLAASLRDVLKPYRKEDVDEVMQIVKEAGGMEKMHIAFYESGDLGNDLIWDVWRLESPSLVCHFRGAPHVHAYINVAKRV